MKLKFEAKKRGRLHRYFFGVSVDIENLWCDNNGRWDYLENIKTESYSNNHRIKTLKAFKRYIKKLNYLPSGTTVRLMNRFVGYGVFYTIP